MKIKRKQGIEGRKMIKTDCIVRVEVFISFGREKETLGNCTFTHFKREDRKMVLKAF